MTQVAVTVWAAVAGGIFGTLGGAALSVPSMIEAAATSEAVIALIKFLQVIDDQLKVQDDASTYICGYVRRQICRIKQLFYL